MDLLNVSDGKMQPPTRTLARFLFQAATLAFIMLASLSLYLTVLKWRGPAVAAFTYIPWDDYIPFRPAWVWIYLIPYLIGPLIVGFLSRDTFAWYIRRGFVLVFVTLAIFVAYPTQTIRPPTNDLGNSRTARFYRNMVAIDDPPANAAPSLHVSLTCLLAWALVKDLPRWWWLSFGVMSLVWLATLFTRQHHLIDVVTGFLLGSAIALPTNRWRSAIRLQRR